MFPFYAVDHVFYNRSLNEQEKSILKKQIFEDKVIRCENKKISVENFLNNPDMDYDSDCETGKKNIFRKTKTVGQGYYQREIPEERPSVYDKRYVISIFGRTLKGESVCVHVINYIPRFYIRIPEGVNETDFMRHFLVTLFSSSRIWNKHKKLFTACIKRHINFYGFTNNKLESFICLKFKNSNTRRQLKFAISKIEVSLGGKKYKPEIFEYSVEPFMRFFHDTGLKVVGFISINGIINRKQKLTNCEYELICLAYQLKNYENDTQLIAPLKRLAFDIETSPLEQSESGMPLINTNDPCICICCDIIQTSKGDSMKDPLMRRKVAFTLNKSIIKEKINEFEIYEYGKNERQMIIDFINLIRDELPDIIFTFNGNTYDWYYLYCRAKNLGILRQFSMANKFINFPARFISQELRSSALGAKELKFIKTPGIINIDLLDVYSRKNIIDIPDIKLNTVSKYYLDKHQNILYSIPEFIEQIKIKNDSEKIKNFLDKHPNILQMDIIEQYKLVYEYLKRSISSDVTKIDLPYKTMFKYYHEASKNPNDPKNIEKMWFIAKYCMQDCTLLHKLVDKCFIVVSSISTANINRYPFGLIFYKGTGPLIYSAITERTQARNYLCPEVENENFETYLERDNELAMVWEAIKDNKQKADAFKKKIMKANSVAGAQVFSPSFGEYENIATLDVKSEYPSIMQAFNISHDTIVLDVQKYGNLPGVKYTDVQWKTADGKEYYSRYVLDLPDRKHKQGVIPEALEYYVSERNVVKKKMKQYNEGSIEYNLYNSEQNALKILSNSIYGQTVFKSSKLFLKPLGGCTTAAARAYITCCKDIVEKSFDAKIIYGDTDSIFIKFNSLKTTPKERFLDVWDQAKTAEGLINKLFESKGLGHVKIELEKVFSKLILFDAKKRYFGLKHVGRNYEKYDPIVMGVTAKKRGATEIEKFVARIVMDLFITNKKEQIIPFIENTCKAIYEGKFSLDYFKKSATIKKHHYTTRVAHDIARKKIKLFDPGNETKLNEKVFFFFYRIPHRSNIRKTDQVHPADYIDHLPEDCRVIDYKIYIRYFIKIVSDIIEIITNEKTKDFTKRIINQFEDIYESNERFPKIC